MKTLKGAIAGFSRLDLPVKLAQAYQLKGKLQTEMLQYEAVEESLRESLCIYGDRNQMGLYASAYLDLGLLFAERDKLDLALQHVS